MRNLLLLLTQSIRWNVASKCFVRVSLEMKRENLMIKWSRLKDFHLTGSNKFIQFNHEQALIPQQEAGAALVELRCKENTNHSQALSARVVVDLDWNGIWYVLQMSEPGKMYYCLLIVSWWMSGDYYLPGKNIAAWNKVHALCHIQVALLPVRVYNIRTSTLGLYLNCVDGNARES